MSRKKLTTRKKSPPNVTAAVNDPKPPAPSLAEKVAAFATIEPDVMLAMDMARDIGVAIGQNEGFAQGLKAPRTTGEARARDQQVFVGKVLSEVFKETVSAIKKHGPMHSPHEGIAVIMEEFDELKEEVYRDRGRQRSARGEAIRLAAMAVRYALDIDPR